MKPRMEMMKRLLLLPFLLWAAPAWAATFGYNAIGSNTTNFTVGDSTIASRGGSTASLRMTVTLGDRLDSARFYLARGGAVDDSVGVAIYASGSFNLDEIIWMDTLVVGTANWYSTGALNLPFPYLPHGYTIHLAVFCINDLGTTIYYSSGSTGDGVTDTSKAPDPWGSNAPLNSNMYSFVGFYTNTATHDWGGPQLRHADSINATYNRTDGGVDAQNNGGATNLSMRSDGTAGTGASATRTVLIDLVNDPRTVGYIQDSIRLYCAFETSMPTGDDSLGIDIFALGKAFGEGNKTAATGTTGESTWDSAKVGTVAWTGEAGGTSSSDHIPTTSLKRWWLGAGEPGVVIDGLVWAMVTIPAPTDSVFTNGLIFVAEENRNGIANASQTFASDDNTVSTPLRKPYVVGWETVDLPDTCSVDHSLSAIDTATSTVVVRNNYNWDGTTMDSMALIWDDDADPGSYLGRVSVTSGITAPDTLTATGLINCVAYYFWWIAYPQACNPDTSASLQVTTDCLAAVRRLILGS